MSRYVFDLSWDKERARLNALEGWLDPGTIQQLESLGVAEGWRCLEVGGGAGSIARWLCARVGPRGHVVATDLDTRFLELIDEPNLEVRRHDILADEIEGGFDLVHARCLLEHLPAREDALERMVSALKPGGWLLVEDMDVITSLPFTHVEVYERVTGAVFGFMQRAGWDPQLGRKLAAMLHAQGLADVIGHGRAEVGRPGPDTPGIEQYRLTLEWLRAGLVSAGVTTDADVDLMLRALEDPEFEGMSPMIVAARARRPA